MKHLFFSQVFVVLLLVSIKAEAQSLIAGIPNASVAHKGKIEITHESQLNWWDGSFKWNSFNFGCYGLNDRTELTFTFNNLSVPDAHNKTLGLGFKRLIPLLKSKPESELKLTIGTNALASVDGLGVGIWSYGHLSTRIPGIKTRLTGGVSYGTEQAFGFNSSKVGGVELITPIRPFSFIGGIEQPITEHFSIIADWFSGNHDLAALITALQYDTEQVTYIMGVKRNNNPQPGSNALIIELMFRF